MDKKIAGLLGAVATLGTFTAAEAAPAPAPTDVLRANSYADLLEPIPNAVALLQAVDESAPAPGTENVQLAQFYYHHHHHHHHHNFYRHHHSYYPRVVVVPRYRRYHHHHHHHHHHHSFYRRDY
ncbi:MAG: hypothetical protein ABJA75_01640 [Bradyrhizobium sp.]